MRCTSPGRITEPAGIHWRFDVVQGASVGSQVGSYISTHLLLPVSHSDDAGGDAALAFNQSSPSSGDVINPTFAKNLGAGFVHGFVESSGSFLIPVGGLGSSIPNANLAPSRPLDSTIAAAVPQDGSSQGLSSSTVWAMPSNVLNRVFTSIPSLDHFTDDLTWPSWAELAT
jgi:hypothetical protein